MLILDIQYPVSMSNWEVYVDVYTSHWHVRLLLLDLSFPQPPRQKKTTTWLFHFNKLVICSLHGKLGSLQCKCKVTSRDLRSPVNRHNWIFPGFHSESSPYHYVEYSISSPKSQYGRANAVDVRCLWLEENPGQLNLIAYSTSHYLHWVWHTSFGWWRDFFRMDIIR